MYIIDILYLQYVFKAMQSKNDAVIQIVPFRKKQQEIILYKSKCGVLQQPSIQALGDEIYKYMCVLCISVHLQGKLDRYLEYI